MLQSYLARLYWQIVIDETECRTYKRVVHVLRIAGMTIHARILREIIRGKYNSVLRN